MFRLWDDTCISQTFEFLRIQGNLSLTLIFNIIHQIKFIVHPIAVNLSFNSCAFSFSICFPRIAGNFSTVSLASFRPKLSNCLLHIFSYLTSLMILIFCAASIPVNSKSKLNFFPYWLKDLLPQLPPPSSVPPLGPLLFIKQLHYRKKIHFLLRKLPWNLAYPRWKPLSNIFQFLQWILVAKLGFPIIWLWAIMDSDHTIPHQ